MRLTIYIDEEEKETLKKIAKDKGLSISSFVRMILKEKIKEYKTRQE